MKLSLKTYKPLVLIWEIMCILSWCKTIFLPAEIEYNYSNVFFALNFVYCIYSIILIWLMPKDFTLSSKKKIAAGILMLGLIISIFF